MKFNTMLLDELSQAKQLIFPTVCKKKIKNKTSINLPPLFINRPLCVLAQRPGSPDRICDLLVSKAQIQK